MSIEKPILPSRPSGVHLSLALLSLAIALFLAAQIGSAKQQSKMMSWQMTTGEKQIANAKTNEVQLNGLIDQQGKLVDQSNAVQEQYQKLLDDLLKLSDEDADAKTIVEKWKVQRSAGKDAADKDKDKEKPAAKK